MSMTQYVTVGHAYVHLICNVSCTILKDVQIYAAKLLFKISYVKLYYNKCNATDIQ